MDDSIFNPLSSTMTLSVFVKTTYAFLYRAWVSQGGPICVAFCDAIPLSANSGHYMQVTTHISCTGL